MAKKQKKDKTVGRVQSNKRGLVRRVVTGRLFRYGYLWCALLVLLASTVLWSYLGAKLHQGNADQLIDAYMFGGKATFHGAEFPSAHTFLLKWPLFLLVAWCGSTATAFIVGTVAISVVTVGALAALLYRIERRPLVFGTICLALASVLLAIPAQPYAGALLPVNMAMIATRNLEYPTYIAALWLCVSAVRLKSWKFIGGVALLAVLIASDKLFLTIGIGSAVIAFMTYRVLRKVQIVYVAMRWFGATVLATAIALFLIWILGATGVAHFTNQADAGGSYGMVHGLHGLVLAGVYAVLDLFANFGANPAYDVTELGAMPHQALQHLSSWGGVALIINVALLAVGLYMACCFVRRSVTTPDVVFANERRSSVALLLLSSGISALAAFVLTDHYYAADARYLAIAFFALSITATVHMAGRHYRARTLLLTGVVLLAAVASGVFITVSSYHKSKQVLQTLNDRNALVAQALAHHPVTALVGDYWRVVPTKLAANNNLHILPLTACGQVRDALTSDAWRFDLQKQSFAYILSFDQNPTGYRNCSLEEVVKTYGRPNSSTIIAGSLSNPQELLLFYDHGAFHSAPKKKHSGAPQDSSTILPTTLDKLPNVLCRQGKTIMNVVAHQDDDLLFMNPSLTHTIAEGNCVRTVYVTAGDSGGDKYYWLSREHGSEAAYATMTPQSDDAWIERQIALSDHQFITVASPKNNPAVSLIFMHLPDGNLNGHGFHSSGYESLARLNSGRETQIRSVDGQSIYNATDLEQVLILLMKAYQPAEVRTQADVMSRRYPDHSDHIAVGQFTGRAFAAYEPIAAQPTGIRYFIGYPIHDMPENVAPADLAQKEAAFFAYAKFDDGVCQDEERCRNTPTYYAYLRREYEHTP